MKNKAELMGAGYAILECFVDRTRILKKLSDSARLLSSYKSIVLHAFMSWVRSTHLGKDCRIWVQALCIGIQFSTLRFRIEMERKKTR